MNRDSIDIYDKCLIYYSKNKIYFDSFLIVFIINFFAYFTKLSGDMLTVDDYARFYFSGDNQSDRGRWANSLFSILLFNGPLHILPYINTLLGILSFSAAGIITSKIFGVERKRDIVIFSLLCSLNPFLAHNYIYNTNTAVWVTTALGVLGVYFILYGNYAKVISGFLLLVIALGTYQITIQIYMAIIMGYVLFKFTKEEKNSINVINISKRGLYLVIIGIMAFLATTLINYIYAHFTNLGMGEAIASRQQIFDGRYDKVFASVGLQEYAKRFVKLYTDKMSLDYYKTTANISFVSLIIFFFVMIRKNIPDKTNFFSCAPFLFTLLFILSMPIIMKTSVLFTGVRAQNHTLYVIGWFFAMAYFFVVLYGRQISKNISFLLAIFILAYSFIYSSTYFFAAHRQADLDLERINNIVTQIRLDPMYKEKNEEPLALGIIGTNRFAVIGCRNCKQGLRYDFSKYHFFKNFTDLDFTIMENAEIISFLKENNINNTNVSDYPGKQSIIVNGNKAVLILNKNSLPSGLK